MTSMFKVKPFFITLSKVWKLKPSQAVHYLIKNRRIWELELTFPEDCWDLEIGFTLNFSDVYLSNTISN